MGRWKVNATPAAALSRSANCASAVAVMAAGSDTARKRTINWSVGGLTNGATGNRAGWAAPVVARLSSSASAVSTTAMMATAICGRRAVGETGECFGLIVDS